MADMYFCDDDLHEAMKVALETLMSISATCDDVVHRANAAIALANLVLSVYDRQHERDVDSEATFEEEEPDEPAG